MKKATYRPKKDLHHEPPVSNSRSVAIVSLHKCATTLITREIVKKSTRYIPISYHSYVYNNDFDVDLTIRETGYLYGIIRLSDPRSPVHRITTSLLHHENFKKLKLLFLIRDPRDLLVSMYYSLGFSHGFSSNPVIRKSQRAYRAKIQDMTIDEYALESAATLQKKFDEISRLMTICDNHILLKYEDMVHSFDYFYEQIDDLLGLDSKVRQRLFKQSRPNDVENIESHKRSGKTNDYTRKLKPETIEQINLSLSKALKEFDYLTLVDKTSS